MVSMILEHFRQQSFISRRLLLAPGGNLNGECEGEIRKAGLATHIFSGSASKRDRALVDKITNISGRALLSVCDKPSCVGCGMVWFVD